MTPLDNGFAMTRETFIRVLKADGTETAEMATIQAEQIIDVDINGKPAFTITCTPSFMHELILGRLYTQGIIAGIQDIQRIEMTEDARNCNVVLADGLDVEAPAQPQVVETAVSANNAGAVVKSSTPLAPVEPIPWKSEWLFNLARKFAEDTPMHKKTWGAHSCYLAVGPQILYCCEDLGRHNALDKVIGCALCDGVDLTKATLFSSGRVPVDMIEKVIRARVPIMMSKAVPTEASVNMARKYKLTMICSARPDSMKVFNGPKPKVG